MAVEKAVVPLENSIEGTVSMTLIIFMILTEFLWKQVVMPISHQLMIHPDNTEIEKIYSHPQALAQCYHFWIKNIKM